MSVPHTLAYTTIPYGVKNYVRMPQEPNASPTTMIHIACASSVICRRSIKAE